MGAVGRWDGSYYLSLDGVPESPEVMGYQDEVMGYHSEVMVIRMR